MTDSGGSVLQMIYTYQTTTEVGTLLSSVLFGILVAQLYQYFTSSTREPVGMRYFVSSIALIELGHIVSLWIYLVDMNHGGILQPGYLIRDTLTVDLALLLSGIVGAIVQSFYAYRIFRFSGSIWLGVPAWAGSMARAGITVSGTVTALKGFNGREHTVPEWITNFSWIMRGVLAVSVVVDVLNTTILCIILGRRRDPGSRTSRVIDKLIVWAIETGMFTSVLAVTMLVIVLLDHVELLPAVIHIYPNMFALSLLLSLNAREGLRHELYAKPSTTSSILVVRMCQTFSEQSSDPEMHAAEAHSMWKEELHAGASSVTVIGHEPPV